MSERSDLWITAPAVAQTSRSTVLAIVITP
jgi:hypothetical protein